MMKATRAVRVRSEALTNRGRAGGVCVVCVWCRPHGEHEEALQSQCVAKEHTEYWGDLVKWGADNVHDTAEQCCEECRRDGLSKASGCNTWVWCGQPGGCGGERRFGECWLKRQSKPAEAIVQAHGEHVGWTSGVLLSEEEAEAKEVFEAQQLATYLARYGPCCVNRRLSVVCANRVGVSSKLRSPRFALTQSIPRYLTVFLSVTQEES